MSFKRIPDLSLFKHQTFIQMRWDDLDPLMHINNVVFSAYFQHARGIYVKDVCPQWDWKKNMFVIGKIEINFHKELSFDHVAPSVLVRINAMENKHFEMEYVVISQKSDQEKRIHASGKTTQIMFDTQSRKATMVPQWFCDAVKLFEKTKIHSD